LLFFHKKKKFNKKERKGSMSMIFSIVFNDNREKRERKTKHNSNIQNEEEKQL